MTGYSPQQLIGTSWTNYVTPESLDIMRKYDILRRRMPEKVPTRYETLLIHARGDVRNAILSMGLIPSSRLSVVSMLDVTERKMAEEKLRQSERQYQSLAAVSPVGIFRTDAAGTTTFVNPKWCEITGMSYDQALKGGWQEALHPEDRAKLISNWKLSVEEHKSSQGEFRFQKPDGSIVSVIGQVVAEKNSNHEITGFVGTITDITERKKAEENLKLFRTLIDQSVDAIEVIDAETGRFLDVNERACQDLGYSREEFLSICVCDIDPLVTESGYKESIENLKKSGTELWRGLHKRKDGSMFPVEVNLKFIRLDKEYILTIVRDISDRTKAEAELMKLSRAVEQSPTSILITDINGHIEYVNQKLLKITGYQRDELIGENPRVFKGGETTKGEYKVLWDTILLGNEWHGEFHNKKKNGELYWEQATISPITNDKGVITHFLAVKEDITGQKKMMDELIRAKEKAEENDMLKSAFLANMSHEIRTPMNGILGFAELLHESDLTGEEQQKYINIIENSGERMLNIIDNLMNISKIEAGQIDVFISQTNINEVVESIYAFFKPEVERKNMQFFYKNALSSEESIIPTDKEKVYAILANLVKNAIKYSALGSLEMGYEKKGNYLEFYVKDNGQGIPKARLHAIFDRFVQADVTDKQALEGAGLGLSIAKAYVEMLDGTIWVKSEEGKGSVFYFTIPCIEVSV